MKLSPVAWVLLLIGIIGVAAATVVVTVTITGTVKVVTPGLTVTPSSLAWGSITVNATRGGSSQLSLVIQNTGQVDFTNVAIAISCSTCPAGFTVSESPALGSLAKTLSWSGTVTLNIAAGTTAGDYSPSLIVSGSI